MRKFNRLEIDTETQAELITVTVTVILYAAITILMSRDNY
jgi:hypothetical protein